MSENQSGNAKQIDNVELIEAVAKQFESAIETSHRAQKVCSMMAIAAEQLADVMKLVKLLRRKFAFRSYLKKERSPKRRIYKRRAQYMLALKTIMRASQINMISSQPIPKFPSGAAIVGERGPEVFI